MVLQAVQNQSAQLVHAAARHRALQAGTAQLVQAADNRLALAAAVPQQGDVLSSEPLPCCLLTTAHLGPVHGSQGGKVSRQGRTHSCRQT